MICDVSGCESAATVEMRTAIRNLITGEVQQYQCGLCEHHLKAGQTGVQLTLNAEESKRISERLGALGIGVPSLVD